MYSEVLVVYSHHRIMFYYFDLSVVHLFILQTWKVPGVTLAGGEPINMCESWNHTFSHLVGNKHPPLWTPTDALRKDSFSVSCLASTRMWSVTQKTSQTVHKTTPGTALRDMHR